MFTWIVTGAAGHLGGTIIRLLEERKAEVRGLVLPHESAADQGETRYFTGDVTLPETLVPLFEGTDPARTLYVGDTVHADVRGAQAAGMPVVQLDPYDLHADFDHLRLPTVAALADLLLGA